MKRITRSLVVTLLCVGCASGVAAQPSQDPDKPAEELRLRARQTQGKIAAAQRRTAARRGGQAEASEQFSRTVRLVRGGTFDLQNVAGDITVTGGGREAKIEALKRVRGINDARARALLEAVRIDVAERGGNVEVRTVHPRGGVARAVVDYTITLPDDANLILRSASGNVHVQGMSGDEVSANTLTGNVTLRDLRSRLIELHTVVGNMLLQDIAAQRALLQSMQGNLEYVGRLQRAGRYQLQTHRGDIRFVPSGDPGFDLEAMTYSGDLRSDFALKVLTPPAARPQVRRQKVLRGTFGDAGAMVTALSFSGNVVIVKP